MPHYNPEIHHRKSIRLKGYNYTQPGYYFVTINLNDIRCMLSVWNGSVLQHTPVGKIANKYWEEIPRHYPNIIIDEHVMMPDHLHGILVITSTPDISNVNHPSPYCKGVQLNTPTQAYSHTKCNGNTTTDTSSRSIPLTPHTNIPCVNHPDHCKGVQLNTPTQAYCHTESSGNNTTKISSGQTDPYYSAISPPGRSLSVIIRNYKATVTRWCKTNGYPQFKWQSNYHEHIIRNQEALHRIRRYIRNNPAALIKEFTGLSR